MRARLVLQLVLATVTAMLSLYFWLRAIGGDPTAPLAQHPLVPVQDHVVRVLGPPHRVRPHVTKSRRPENAARGVLRLEAVRAAAVIVERPSPAASPPPPSHSGGASSNPPAPPTSPPAPPTSSPPPPPPPPSPPPSPPSPSTPTGPSAPKPPPPPPAAPPSAPPPSTKPGWGCGDSNHTHTGPPGQNGKDKESPC